MKEDDAIAKSQPPAYPTKISSSPSKAAVASTAKMIPFQKDLEEMLTCNEIIDVESDDEGNQIISHLASSGQFSVLPASPGQNKEESEHQLKLSNADRNMYNPVRVEKVQAKSTRSAQNAYHCKTNSA